MNWETEMFLKCYKDYYIPYAEQIAADCHYDIKETTMELAYVVENSVRLRTAELADCGDEYHGHVLNNVLNNVDYKAIATHYIDQYYDSIYSDT